MSNVIPLPCSGPINDCRYWLGTRKLPCGACPVGAQARAVELDSACADGDLDEIRDAIAVAVARERGWQITDERFSVAQLDDSDPKDCDSYIIDHAVGFVSGARLVAVLSFSYVPISKCIQSLAVERGLSIEFLAVVNTPAFGHAMLITKST